MTDLHNLKAHTLYISLIVVLVVVVFWPAVLHYDELKGVAYNDAWSYLSRIETTKASIEKYNDFIPLWSPYTMSGSPFFGRMGSEIGFFYLNYPLLAVFPPAIALRLAYLLSVLLAGIAMYMLMSYLKLEKKFALISSIIYMFNGWVFTRMRWGHLTTISPYAITPLIILFMVKAFKEKEWIKNSVILGILFAIQIHGGPDMKVTLWVIPVIFLYALFRLIENFSLGKIIKISLIGTIIIAATFGLTAVKILPALDFLDIGARVGLDFDKARSQRVEWKNLFVDLIEPLPPKIQNQDAHYNIGIISFLLAGYAVFKKYKNRMIIYFALIALLGILLSTGSFLFYLFWKYAPFYNSFRYPSRILAIYTLAIAALAGYGASILAERLREKYKWEEKKISIMVIALILLALANNTVFGVYPYTKGEWISPEDALKDNNIYQYLGKQQGIFRIHTYENTGIDWSTDFQSIPLNLQMLYGYDTAWLVDYMNVYLSIAFRDPAKFWGMLNTKYVTSEKELNISGLKLLQKFERCRKCLLDVGKYTKLYGPYLYENERFLPRAYIAPNSILIIGKKEDIMQLTYGLMADKRFDPSKLVIIQGRESINDYSLDELMRHNVVFLTSGPIDQNSYSNLKGYIGSRGMLIPDITQGEQEISEEKISEMWGSLKGEISPISDEVHGFISFDKRKLALNGKKGFLVYSEILTYYPGWTARADRVNKEIYRADGVIGAVYLDSPTEEVILEFKPKSFTAGSAITIITIIILVIFFTFRHIHMKNLHSPA